MTEPAHIYEQIGGLTLPPAVSDEPTLIDLDPARDKLLALFKAGMNAELGDRWAAAVKGLATKHPLYNSKPVRDALSLEATLAHMQQREAGFPLLCLHRSGRGDYEPHTLDSEKLIQPWQLSYILGPLEIADVRRFGDACIFFSKLVSAILRRRGHPAYQGGAMQFFGGSDLAEVGAIRIVSHEGPGQAHFAGSDPNGTTYYAITINLETIEYARQNADGESCPLQGADYDFGLGGAPEGIARGLFYSSTDPPLQPQ